MSEKSKKLTLESAPKEDFAEAFEDMKMHFSEEEMKTYERFISLIDSCEYTFLQIKDGEQKVGYLLLFLEQMGRFVWLEYLVIKKEFQSMGYGSKVLKVLKSSFPNMNGAFLEIEHENEAFVNTAKRIKFYERNGAKKLDLSYVYPNKKGGKQMYLFYLPIKKDSLLPDKKEILKVVKRVFEHLHADVAGIDEIYGKIAGTD